MTNPLGDLISKGEGGYNSYNRGTKDHRIAPANQAIDFSAMTLDELQRRQHLPTTDPDRVFAVGKYQLIPSTLKETIDHLKLQGNARFTPELQEMMFSDHLIKQKRPEVYAYIVGQSKATLHGALKAISNEWASVEDPDTPGRPAKHYYDAGNRASTRASDVASALNEMRDNYRMFLQKGLAPADAWRSVTGQLSLERETETHTRSRPVPTRSSQPPAKQRSWAHEFTVKRRQSIVALQENLAQLGYRDRDGHSLVIDGHLGPNTLYAIKSFQHAHGLRVDGIVGPRTLAALEDARRWPLLSEATHPQHRLYSRIEQGIRALPGHAHRGDRELGNAAVALTIAAHTSGLSRVDHVVLGSDGVNLFAIQGRMDDPAHRRVHVELAHALHHTVEPMAMTMGAPGPPLDAAHVDMAAAHAAHQAAAPRAPVMPGP